MLDSPSTQQKFVNSNALSLKGRELPHNEPIMDAVACWNGSMRRFCLRKRSTVCLLQKIYSFFLIFIIFLGSYKSHLDNFYY